MLPAFPHWLSTLNHTPLWPGVKLLSTLALVPHSNREYIFCVIVCLFLLLLMDIVPLFFSACHLWPLCDVQTGGGAAGGGGGEAVTFKLRLSNPSLSEGLRMFEQTRERKGKKGEKDQIHSTANDRVDVRLLKSCFLNWNR